MTIQRKYSLPSCVLVVEGLNDMATSASPTDSRPVLSTLVNVECYFPNSGQPSLSGGREFLESFVKSTSSYTQEFLSKIPHRQAQTHEQELVQLHKLDPHRHQLIVRSTPQVEPVKIDLTTVQLFDLVDAVDQLLADSRTLPDLALKISPVSKRNVTSRQDVAKQSVPAALGVSSLAFAAIAFFLVPIPEVQPPKPVPQSSSQSNLANNRAPEITDPVQLSALNQQLYNRLDSAWQMRKMTQDLSYQVIVSSQGAIVGYKALDAASSDQIDQTPLRSLLTTSSATPSVSPQPIAQYGVIFDKDNKLKITNWAEKK